MLNVCFKCGSYRADKIIDPQGPVAICPECGHRHRFLYLPLLIVSGASGTGKSFICNQLMGTYQDAVLLDSDILWRDAFNKPENNYRDFFETWLRMCKNIHQSGKPVVLFGAGFGVPENLENCLERRYFPEIRYLALTCSDEILSERLQQRPVWQSSRQRGFIDDQQRFNQWFINYNKNQSQPSITLLDTSRKSVKETAHEVKTWINEGLKRVNAPPKPL
jgi:hypothetical protein